MGAQAIWLKVKLDIVGCPILRPAKKHGAEDCCACVSARGLRLRSTLEPAKRSLHGRICHCHGCKPRHTIDAISKGMAAHAGIDSVANEDAVDVPSSGIAIC